MAFDIKKYVNPSNPIAKIADKLATSFADKAENALLDSVGDIFAKVGIGASSGKDILSNLGDAVLASIAAEFFGAFNKEVNRISKENIELNKGFADADTEGLDQIITPPGSLSITCFPPDLNKYHIKFEFKKYERPTPKEVAKFEAINSVALPIPRNLEDRNSISYSQPSLGAAGAIADYVMQQEKNLAGAGMTAVGSSLAKRAAYGISQEAGQIAGQLTGSIVNPNISVVFDSPTLRRHSFEWTLAPETEKESERIREIIKIFKQAALPTFLSDTTAFLDYPLICKVSLMPWADKDNSNLYQFKTCVIENLSVNYAPNTLAFFDTEDADNPAPALVQLRLELLEIEYFTGRDYGAKERGLAEIQDDIVGKVQDTLVKNNILDETATPPDPPAGSEQTSSTPPSETPVTSTSQYTETNNQTTYNYAKVGEDWYVQTVTSNPENGAPVASSWDLSADDKGKDTPTFQTSSPSETTTGNFVVGVGGNTVEPTSETT